MSDVTKLTAGNVVAGPYDVERLRADFPILASEVHGKPLVFLDSAASAQKPKAVIDADRWAYEHCYANVHRGVYYLSEKTTEAFEGARETVRRFINARSTREVIFTRGTTESINLVAQTFGRSRLGPGDEVVISHMEHHSNIVPWQMVCEQTGATLKVVPINDAGEVDVEAYADMLGPKVKLVAMVHVSNALGTVVPIGEVIKLAHAHDIPVLVDGAQAAPHAPVDVQALDADFYAFSGHKVYGPTGIGVLYGKEALLDAMPPWQGGGDMIASVSFEKTTYASLPAKFEAGTPHIVGAIGLAAALDYVSGIGLDAIAAHEADLLAYATERMRAFNQVRIVGQARRKAGVLSFTIENVHPHDIGTILDHQGVAVRAGHHCAQPVMQRFNVPATARASFGLYNTREDIDRLVEGVAKVIDLMG